MDDYLILMFGFLRIFDTLRNFYLAVKVTYELETTHGYSNRPLKIDEVG